MQRLSCDNYVLLPDACPANLLRFWNSSGFDWTLYWQSDDMHLKVWQTLEKWDAHLRCQHAAHRASVLAATLPVPALLYV